MTVSLTGDGPNIALTGSGSSFTITVTTGGGGGGGVTDHGALTGLADDDHTQYLNNARGDARYQPLDSDLTAIAALSTTSFGRSLLALADAAAGRTALSLGTAATAATGDFEAAGAVAAHTGDTSAAHAASAISVGTLNGNLSAVSGTDVEQALQAVDNLSLGGTVDVVSNVATNTILGRVTSGSGNSEELTAAQVRSVIGARWVTLHDADVDTASLSVDITGYKQIRGRFFGRSGRTGFNADDMAIRFNNDSGSNYSTQTAALTTVLAPGTIAASQTNTDRRGVIEFIFGIGSSAYTIGGATADRMASTATTGSNRANVTMLWNGSVSAAATSIQLYCLNGNLIGHVLIEGVT